MYQIAICDDEPVFLQSLRNSVLAACDNQNIPHEIVCFTSSKDLLFTVLTNKSKFDLFLLDILIEDLNGMELAKKLREISDYGTIIFVTSTNEYALQGYEVCAVRYLVKPIEPEILESLISDDYHNRFLEHYITLPLETHSERIAFDDILALEIVGRKTAIYLKDRVLTYTGKLSDVLEFFPENLFIHTHQSYALNLKNIKAIDKQYAVTAGNQVFPISRSRLKDVQNKFLSYMGR